MDSIASTSNSSLESELAQDAGEVNHLRRLYLEVLDIYIKERNISYDAMDAAISAVIDSFKYSEGRRFSEIDLKRPDMRCGFVFRYGAHGAALVRCRILEAFRACPELKSILSKKELKVISLGSGPGNDAIGFCSAMSRSNFLGKLVIYMADVIPYWSELVDIAEKLLGQGNFGEASELFLHEQVFLFYGESEYILPNHLSNLRLLRFDIVLICKLLSIMEDGDERRIFPKKLYEQVKESALILYIDTPFDETLWCKWFDILYLSKEGQEFRSGDKRMRKFGNHHDYVSSKSRIAVLRKKRMC